MEEEEEIEAAEEEKEEDAVLRKKVHKSRVGPMSFTAGGNGPYVEAYNLLGAITDVPILLSPGGKSVISDEDLELELNIVAPMNLQNILDLMASSSENLDWTIRNGVVVITEVEANAKDKRKNPKRDR